jgi:hypothetical protein
LQPRRGGARARRGTARAPPRAQVPTTLSERHKTNIRAGWAAMRSAAPATAMPQHVPIRVDVGGTVFRTSLHTLMEGARLGGVVFQALCLQILGPEPLAAAARGTSAWCPRRTRSMA